MCRLDLDAECRVSMPSEALQRTAHKSALAFRALVLSTKRKTNNCDLNKLLGANLIVILFRLTLT